MSQPQPVTFPGVEAVTVPWVKNLAKQLVQASWAGQDALPQILTPVTVVTFLDGVKNHLEGLPPLVKARRCRPVAHHSASLLHGGQVHTCQKLAKYPVTVAALIGLESSLLLS